MSIVVSRRPLDFSSSILRSLLGVTFCISRRHESSARRTTKRLRNKPDSSFSSSISRLQANDHIVFNPPSSAPSPYHTPPVFLPPNDPRRELLAQSHVHANPYSQPHQRLPPMIKSHAPYEKKYHLREKDFEEIRKLRTADPTKWTRSKLAEKFGCSQFFVGLVCQASKEKLAKDREELEQTKEKWGRRKRFAREDRAKRRELWARDE
ncbi:hypothetical protein ACLMJK_000446 [Lecanora helva]